MNSADTQQPVLFKGLAVAEFTRWMADEVLTLLNDTAQEQSGDVRCDFKANGGWAVRLAPQEVKILCITESTEPTSE